MKLYFITILFSFVIVFVNSEKIKFMKQVIINNDYIRQTLRAEKLHTAVKNILSGSEPMADVSLMLAVPDFAVTSANVRKLTISTSREEDLGKILKQLMSDCIQPHPHSQREVKDAERANIVALANERRVLIMEAITKIASEGGLNVESLGTCRLVGLIRSIIHFIHDSYTVKAEVEHGICKLTTKLDIVIDYVQYPDGIYEVVLDGSIGLKKFI
ncbi:uncharacterized protein LOC126847441 isoform X8 [Adelges cooleyi]|uniref:uncharacterized protein LOC126847441 isoform X8 n=1 Tax=Adelges cooleyi TaxID=133065 RepID=UPI00217FB7E0|nr:uncharacterized protein LOC126847441 isoform X8 [Adelges cooleyi]